MNSILTSRERLRRCFYHQEMDRPGVYCRPGLPVGDKSYDPLRKLLQQKADLKSWFYAEKLINDHIIITEEEYSDSFKKKIETMPTCSGDLTCITMISLKHQPQYIHKHFLTSLDDAEKYLHAYNPEIEGPVDLFFELDKQIADRGIPDVFLGSNPAGKIATLFGSETFAMMSITDREILHLLCEKEMNIKIKLLDYLLEKGIGPFFSMDGEELLVPPLHNPLDFRDFNLRYDKPIIDRIHEAGGRIHIHCHGSLKKVLPYFVEMGVDVLHPIEAPPMGDVTAKEAKSILGGKVCIEGNIQIADMYEQPAEAIQFQTMELINDAFSDNKGLIVCPSASPYIYGAGLKCYQQFKKMIETVKDFKR
jgi:hypothetical protein